MHALDLFVLPLHVLCLRLLGTPILPEFEILTRVFKQQFGARAQDGQEGWAKEMAKTVGSLTVLIALPGLSWYLAVPLTSMTSESL